MSAPFRVHFIDGIKITINAANATEASKVARALYVKQNGGETAPPVSKIKVLKEKPLC